MPFSTVFQLYCSSQCTYPFFPRVFLTSTPHNILSKLLPAFPHNHCETTDSGEREMNPVAMTITHLRKEYWPGWGSNQRPPVLKSAMLLELDENGEKFSKRVENTEKRRNKQFLLFPLCFLKTCTADT